MSREKVGYRENLRLLDARFPDCDMLTPKQVAAFMGCSPETAKRRVQFNQTTRRVSKTDLARQISV